MRKTGNVVLVLTATVTPNVRGGVICDNKIRLRMYLEAIEWYINNTFYKMLLRKIRALKSKIYSAKDNSKIGWSL